VTPQADPIYLLIDHEGAAARTRDGALAGWSLPALIQRLRENPDLAGRTRLGILRVSGPTDRILPRLAALHGNTQRSARSAAARTGQEWIGADLADLGGSVHLGPPPRLLLVADQPSTVDSSGVDSSGVDSSGVDGSGADNSGSAALPDPAGWDRRDTVLDGVCVRDGYDRPAVDLRAASVRGPAHRRTGQARQQEYAYRCTVDRRYLVAAVCDGGYGGRHSHRAATLVARRGTAALASMLAHCPPEELDWAGLIARLSDEIVRLAATVADPPPGGRQEAAAHMMTTATFAIVDLESTPRTAHLCTAGNSPTWILRNPTAATGSGPNGGGRHLRIAVQRGPEPTIQRINGSSAEPNTSPENHIDTGHHDWPTTQGANGSSAARHTRLDVQLAQRSGAAHHDRPDLKRHNGSSSGHAADDSGHGTGVDLVRRTKYESVALPLPQPAPVTAVSLTLGAADVLVLATEGIGEPRAGAWDRPPAPLDFAARLDSAGCADGDRTILAIWPR
jgi:hypothetical protein